MAAQTTYSWKTQYGAAGGIVDLAPYAIDTRMNEEDTGTMKFGVGVVVGTHAGSQVKLPDSEATSADFEGIVTNNRTTEYDLVGKIYIRENAAMGVMRYGRIYARVATGATPAYGDPLYLVISGTDAGCFTEDAEDGIPVKGRFLSAVDGSTQIAMVELFNQSQVEANIANIGGIDLSTPATDGQVLKYDGASETWKPAADET